MKRKRKGKKRGFEGEEGDKDDVAIYLSLLSKRSN